MSSLFLLLMLGPLLPRDTPAATRDRVDQETCGNDPQAAIVERPAEFQDNLRRVLRSMEVGR